MPRPRAIFEGLFVFCLGGLVLYVLRHHVVLAYLLGMAICVVGWGTIWAVEKRKKMIGPVSTFRTPEPTGTVTAGVGIVLNPDDPNSKVKMMQHGTVRPGLQTGDLPINMTTEGPSGHREVADGTESWVWTFRDVTFFNESSQHETAHAWLMVNSSGEPGFIQLQRLPNTPIVLNPHETKQETLVFRLSMISWTEDERLNPGSPVRLELIGASSIRQSRRVFFTK